MVKSVAYAKISLMTAYLKCYYPVEFMAALLTMSEGKKDKQGNPKNITYMKDCEDMNIIILPPDVNISLDIWTPKTYKSPILVENKQLIGEIRYGLGSIAGISIETVGELTTNRPYLSVEDMIAKTNGVKVNKSKIVNLIKSGSFDSIQKNRNLLLRNYYLSRGEEYDHISEATSKMQILQYEREVFGTAISIKSRWDKIEDGAKTQITGIITHSETWTAKSGKTHYTLTVETNEEPIYVTVWGYKVDKEPNKYAINNKVTIKGEKSRDKLTAESVSVHPTKANPFEVELSAEPVLTY